MTSEVELFVDIMSYLWTAKKNLRNEGFFQPPEIWVTIPKKGGWRVPMVCIDRIFGEFPPQASWVFPGDSWRREKPLQWNGEVTMPWRWGHYQNDARPLRGRWILRVEFCALDFAPIFSGVELLNLQFSVFFSHLYNWGNSTCGNLLFNHSIAHFQCLGVQHHK